MAGLDPAIHALLCGSEDVDARVKPGHDELEFDAALGARYDKSELTYFGEQTA
jgi:hypothetical protein